MRSRLAYATLLEIEFVLALAVSYFMGSKAWIACIVSLILTLLLGIYTSLWSYTRQLLQTRTLPQPTPSPQRSMIAHCRRIVSKMLHGMVT